MTEQLVSEALELASGLLADELPRRWEHVKAVGAAGASLPVVGLDVELVEASGYLHDVGYSSALVETGFHPIDGARYLQGVGFDRRVVNLVANHSCAAIEARHRGLDEVLRKDFPVDPDLPHDELCYCDMTNGLGGQPMALDERLADILSRYGPGSIVFDAVTEARPKFERIVARVQARFDSAAFTR